MRFEVMFTEYSRKSHRSRTFTKSGSSKSSCRETLITCHAKRAALQEKLRFSSVIAEQENKLEQLKIQKELEEITAQEAVYQRAMDEENELDKEQEPLLPTALHNPIDAFLNSKEEAALTSTPEAPILTSSTQQTSVANDVIVTSSPPTPFLGSHSQSAFPTSQSTPPQAPPVPSVQEPQRTVHPFSPVYTKTSFSIGGQNPPIIPTASAAQPGYHPDKVLKLQRKKGKDAFPCFEEFAEERTNIPQILQSPGTNGAMTADRGKFAGCNSQRHRNANVALTSASPPDNDIEPRPLNEESQVEAHKWQQLKLSNQVQPLHLLLEHTAFITR